MNDYPNNETLIAVIDAIDETKQNKEDKTLTTIDKTIIGAINEINTELNDKVPTSRTVNGKALTSNITLSASDVSAYSKTEIDNMEFITIADIDAICGGTIYAGSEVRF